MFGKVGDRKQLETTRGGSTKLCLYTILIFNGSLLARHAEEVVSEVKHAIFLQLVAEYLKIAGFNGAILIEFYLLKIRISATLSYFVRKYGHIDFRSFPDVPVRVRLSAVSGGTTLIGSMRGIELVTLHAFAGRRAAV